MSCEQNTLVAAVKVIGAGSVIMTSSVAAHNVVSSVTVIVYVPCTMQLNYSGLV
jgi:hypothetical protein